MLLKQSRLDMGMGLATNYLLVRMRKYRILLAQNGILCRRRYRKCRHYPEGKNFRQHKWLCGTWGIPVLTALRPCVAPLSVSPFLGTYNNHTKYESICGLNSERMMDFTPDSSAPPPWALNKRSHPPFPQCRRGLQGTDVCSRSECRRAPRRCPCRSAAVPAHWPMA